MNFFKSIKKHIYSFNRKVHIYTGLFLLLFIWLFSISGLLLNNGSWAISSYWEQRKDFTTVSNVTIPETRNSTELIENFMAQLEMKGEVSNIKIWSDSLYFRVSVPGHVQNITINFKNGRCVQNQLKFNLAGILSTMHMFNGVDRNDPRSKPNWWITKIWRFSMDGVAIGLILLCMSSWVMWFKVRKKFRWSFTVLVIGFGIVAYFVYALAWI